MEMHIPHVNAEDQRKMVADEIAEIHQAVVGEAASGTMTDIPERVFQYVFLPMFAGKPSQSPNATPEKWLALVGGPFRSARVVDAQGKELFIVPPWSDSRIIQVVNAAASSMDHVTKTSHQMHDANPHGSQSYLFEKLRARAMPSDQLPESVLEYVRQWNAIFTRYGEAPLVPLDDAPETKADAADDDFLSYDPI